MSYGRFHGQGVVKMDSGVIVRRSVARTIIAMFEDSGHSPSVSGITTEIVAAYCEDVNIPFHIERTEATTQVVRESDGTRSEDTK